MYNPEKFESSLRKSFPNVVNKKDPRLTMSKTLQEWLLERVYALPSVSALCQDIIRETLVSFFPVLDTEKSPDYFWIWLSESDRNKEGKKGRTLIKAGKGFRKMFPFFSDKEIETLVDAFKIQFEKESWNVLSGTDADSFKFAYLDSNYAPFKNLSCTSNVKKSLANSCMRHSFNHLPCHPSEIYATGEFEIYYARCRGKVGARCVVWNGHGSDTPQAGPIYASSEGSFKAIKSELDSLGVEHLGDWEGARVKKVRAEAGFVGIYIDVSADEYEDSRGYLTLTDSGSLGGACHSSGTVGGKPCCSCGGSLSEGETMHYGEDAYCEYCFNEEFGYCEHSDETVPIGELESVYVSVHREEMWGEHARDYHATYIEHRNEFWSNRLVFEDHYGESICAEDLEDGDWGMCEFTGDYFPSCELRNTEDGELVAECELIDREYQEGPDGVWFDPSEVEEENKKEFENA